MESGEPVWGLLGASRGGEGAYAIAREGRPGDGPAQILASIRH
jgi:hypothetical protein